MTRRLAPLLALALLALAAPPALAQRGSTGIGAQVGRPTGVALKIPSGARAFDLAAGWDLGERIFAQGHLLLHDRRLPGTGTDLRAFYGPGLFAGARDDDVALGFSFNAGLAYHSGPLEVFGQLTPHFALVPSTRFRLGGALGVRFYP